LGHVKYIKLNTNFPTVYRNTRTKTYIFSELVVALDRSDSAAHQKHALRERTGRRYSTSLTQLLKLRSSRKGSRNSLASHSWIVSYSPRQCHRGVTRSLSAGSLLGRIRRTRGRSARVTSETAQRESETCVHFTRRLYVAEGERRSSSTVGSSCLRNRDLSSLSHRRER